VWRGQCAVCTASTRPGLVANGKAVCRFPWSKIGSVHGHFCAHDTAGEDRHVGSDVDGLGSHY